MAGLACGAVLAAVACSSSTSSSLGGLDGDWDVVVFGDAELKPSSFHIEDGNVTGAFVDEDEGTKQNWPVYDSASGSYKTVSCQIVTRRAEVNFVVKGNALSGSITDVRKYTGDEGCPPDDRDIEATITGTRVSGSGDSLDGEWRLTDGDSTVTAKVNGNAIHIDTGDAETSFDISNDDGFVVSSSKDAQFSFRKR